jgi:DNA (cytosine-5)-methyltransferase 1
MIPTTGSFSLENYDPESKRAKKTAIFERRTLSTLSMRRPSITGTSGQPFSSAGRQRGRSDERHLWPVWFRLIRECRPSTVFGEQVASAIAHEWLDEAAHDLESEGHAVAASVLPACSVGAPHRRDRLWFVADAAGEQVGPAGQSRQHQDVADSTQQLFNRRRISRPQGGKESSDGDHVGNARCKGLEIRSEPDYRPGNVRQQGPSSIEASHRGWGSEWLLCHDGKVRPVKSGVRLLAHGIPARVGRLRAYGNAIVPQLAAELIRAFMQRRP